MGGSTVLVTGPEIWFKFGRWKKKEGWPGHVLEHVCFLSALIAVGSTEQGSCRTLGIPSRVEKHGTNFETSVESMRLDNMKLNILK